MKIKLNTPEGGTLEFPTKAEGKVFLELEAAFGNHHTALEEPTDAADADADTSGVEVPAEPKSPKTGAKR